MSIEYFTQCIFLDAPESTKTNMFGIDCHHVCLEIIVFANCLHENV